MIQEVIIYGGCGQLGRAVLTLFKENGYKTISIDRIANNDADQNIIGPGGFTIIFSFDFRLTETPINL